MYRWFTLLFSVVAGFAQPGPTPLAVPPSSIPDSLREYLGLSSQQVSAINNINLEHNRLVLEKQLRIAQVQAEIVEETAREPLDPGALGLRYAELEAIRRHLRDSQSRARQDAQALLTDVQKQKLRALEEAMKLQAITSGALCVNLVAQAAVTEPSRWFDTTSFAPVLLAQTSLASSAPLFIGVGCGVSVIPASRLR